MTRPATELIAVSALAVVGCVVVLVADTRGQMPTASVVLDIVVGLALFALVALSRDRLTVRLCWLAAAIAWCAASLAPQLAAVHQGALLLGVVAAAGLRRHDLLAVALSGAAALIAIGIVPQPLTGAVFLVVGIRCGVRAVRTPRLWRETVAAVAIGLELFAAWAWARGSEGSFEPYLAFDVYALVLVGVVALLLIGRRGATVVATVSPAAAAGGLAGLERILANALGDDALRIVPADAPANDVRTIDVRDGSAVVAHLIVGRELDRVTLDNTIEAVRLVAAREKLAADVEVERRAVASARERLAQAARDQRAAMSDRLRVRVEPPLHSARQRLGAVGDADSVTPTHQAALAIDGAIADVAALVAGLSDHRIAGGDLPNALRELGSRYGTLVTVTADAVDVNDEFATSLFYAASEALTNAVKHAQARCIEVRLSRDGDRVILTVVDDGIGGADASGRGIQGLRKRIASAGGNLAIDSDEERGTTVVVALPPRSRDLDPRIDRPLHL